MVTIAEQPIGDDDLQAFVDGRLAGARLAAVEAYLSLHPQIAADIAQDREISEHLRARLAAKVAEPIPARLRVAHLLAERRRRRNDGLRLVAASIVLICLGAVGGWFAKGEIGRSARMETADTRDAIAAYRTFVVEKLHPVEVRAGEEAHLAQWLSRRLGRPIKPPDLSPEGYHLIGGRLLPTLRESPAAMFMYQDDAGHRLTLYAHAEGDGQGAGVAVTHQADIAALSWADRSLAYVLTAPAETADLMGAVKAIARQLQPDGAGQI